MGTKNLASGTLSETITTSSTTLLVYVGAGSASTIKGVFPTAPFYITVMPFAPNAGVANSLDSEIMLVTAVSNDQVGNVALTVTRAQRNTTAKAFNSGAIVTNGIYMDDILDKFYPVGSYYETSDSSFNPNTAWGGTWVEDTAGRVLVAMDTGTFTTVGATGGEETHTLTVSEMPSHVHKLRKYIENGSSSGWVLENVNRTYNYTSEDCQATGGDQSHNNLQPYTVVKRWHRIA